VATSRPERSASGTAVLRARRDDDEGAPRQEVDAARHAEAVGADIHDASERVGKAGRIPRHRLRDGPHDRVTNPVDSIQREGQLLGPCRLAKVSRERKVLKSPAKKGGPEEERVAMQLPEEDSAWILGS